MRMPPDETRRKRRFRRWLRLDELVWNSDELDSGIILAVYGMVGLMTGFGDHPWVHLIALVVGTMEIALSHHRIAHNAAGRMADVRRSLPLVGSMVWGHEALGAWWSWRYDGEADIVLVLSLFAAWLAWRGAKGYLRLCTVKTVGLYSREMAREEMEGGNET